MRYQAITYLNFARLSMRTENSHPLMFAFPVADGPRLHGVL